MDEGGSMRRNRAPAVGNSMGLQIKAMLLNLSVAICSVNAFYAELPLATGREGSLHHSLHEPG